MTNAPTPTPAGLAVRGGPWRLTDFRLAAFDMDSTLIDMECVDEIAAAAGRKAQVAAITEAAMRGEITDYATSLRERLALLAGVPESALHALYVQRLRLNPGVEAFIDACRAARLKTLLISGGFTYFTERLRQRLGFDFARGNQLEIIDGRLTGRLVPQSWGEVVDGAEKRRTVLEVCSLLGISPTQALAVGDGANDLPMMRAVGLAIAFHAKPAVAAEAQIAIQQGGLDGALAVLKA